MRATRLLLGSVGIVMTLVGARYLLAILERGGPSRVVAIGLWSTGGVVLHDAVVAPLVVVVGVLVVPRLPSWSRVPVTAGLVVLLSVTLLAVPVLGGFGRRPDVPSLLDRPYGLLWLGLAALVTGCVVVASLHRRRTSPGAPPPGDRQVPEDPVDQEAG